MIVRVISARNSLTTRSIKSITTLGMCMVLFVGPTITGILTACMWYFVFHRDGIAFAEKLEGLFTGAWAFLFGGVYIADASLALATVWGEYKTMRASVKQYDFDKFVDLVDEDLSPIMHMIALVSSVGIILGMWLVKYPDVLSGIVMTFGVGFLLTFMLVVVREMDDPCKGVWRIRGIHPEWLTIDPKQYRKERSRKLQEEFIRKYCPPDWKSEKVA